MIGEIANSFKDGNDVLASKYELEGIEGFLPIKSLQSVLLQDLGFVLHS